MSTPPFDRGGFLPAHLEPVPVTIDVDECIIRASDVREGRAVCWRADPEHLAALNVTAVPHPVVWTVKPLSTLDNRPREASCICPRRIHCAVRCHVRDPRR